MKKLIVALFAALLVLSVSVCAEVVDSGECGDNVTWTLDDEGTLKISGEGGMENYFLYDYSPWYNDGEAIKNIVIDDGVTSIGDFVFYDCVRLASIGIPDSVTSIGDFAFYDCESLTSIEIPDSVTSIGDNAFSGCDSLTSIEIPDSVTSIGDSAFSCCSSLATVYYCGSEEWNKIEIGEYNYYLLEAEIIFNYVPVVEEADEAEEKIVYVPQTGDSNVSADNDNTLLIVIIVCSTVVCMGIILAVVIVIAIVLKHKRLSGKNNQ